MAAFLQWRRFIFFEKESVRLPGEGGKPLTLPPGLTVCDSGRGSLLFGDMTGQIWFLPRSLQLSSFQAYKLRVTHLHQLKQHSILVSVGEDEEGVNPVVKVWNLEKRDGGNPLCTRIFPAIPGNKPTVVSCITVHENLNFMAIGFADGSVVLTKGDITRDRHSKTQILQEGSYPITGMAFRQTGKTTHLFVVTTECVRMLFKKNLYVMAISLAKGQHLDSDGLSEIFRQYGDHLYNKGDHDGAIQQYIRTIGKLEPSYVIRKFLDAQRIHNLTAYLQALHLQSLANADHTTLLLNCYTKLKDSARLEEFIKASEDEVHFDVEIAIKVLRQAGYHSHALYLAEKHAHHEWYLKVQLEDIKNFQEALRYIGRLPFPQAESNMKCYGKILMYHVPNETTQLLNDLCTTLPQHGEGKRANPEEFIPIFANNPCELKTFLEHMTRVQSDSPQGVYDTLLELRLQNWAHESDPQAKQQLQNDAMTLLKSGRFKNVFDKALVLCQMHNFQKGVLYLYEQGKLFQQIMHYHMQNDQYQEVIEACKQYGEQESCLWEQALSYFARKEEDCKEHIATVLRHIESKNLMPPLLVVQTLAHNSTATLSVIRDYLINKMQKLSQQTEEDERTVNQYREDTARIRREIHELRNSPKIFQKTKCSICSSALELPSVHFLCGHSFHQHCFESYAESDSDCPTCLPENRQVLDMIRAQEEKKDLYDQFQHQLKCSNDGFSVVAEYFGRGVFNKLTLITDAPTGRMGGAKDAGLQRELLINTRRNL
ncbi:vacuolar protein sorting-associated protein 11 homolog isoform X2 [Mixophyes fleayi]|uniref:vacuolar protein sorting-associated protein 11 homolog isoform X2 n=1 Tax=Mixophyes fleayi TaxID=3061075 RepID=UPI003F4DF825